MIACGIHPVLNFHCSSIDYIFYATLDLYTCPCVKFHCINRVKYELLKQEE